MQLQQKLFVTPKKRNLKLGDWSPDYDGDKKKENVDHELARLTSCMSELQYKLFADNSKSLFIILQGVDASGKDGTIRHVMTLLILEV